MTVEIKLCSSWSIRTEEEGHGLVKKRNKPMQFKYSPRSSGICTQTAKYEDKKIQDQGKYNNRKIYSYILSVCLIFSVLVFVFMYGDLWYY